MPTHRAGISQCSLRGGHYYGGIKFNVYYCGVFVRSRYTTPTENTCRCVLTNQPTNQPRSFQQGPWYTIQKSKSAQERKSSSTNLFGFCLFIVSINGPHNNNFLFLSVFHPTTYYIYLRRAYITLTFHVPLGPYL